MWSTDGCAFCLVWSNGTTILSCVVVWLCYLSCVVVWLKLSVVRGRTAEASVLCGRMVEASVLCGRIRYHFKSVWSYGTCTQVLKW